MSCLVELKTELPDGRAATILEVRKRGLGKPSRADKSARYATFSYLGGAAHFKDSDTATQLLESIPEGSHVDSPDAINGYLLEDVEDGIVGARVKGFKTVEAQASYESQVGDAISFEETIATETQQELIDELPDVREKASVMFDGVSQPRSWGETPQHLLDEINKAEFYGRKSVFVDRNRISNRNDLPEVTHSVVEFGQVDVSRDTTAELIQSGHLTVLDGGARKVDSPFIAIPDDYMQEIKGKIKQAIESDPGVEDVDVDVAFGDSGRVAISSQLAM